MSPHVLIFHAAFTILLQVIFFNIVISESTTYFNNSNDYKSLWKSERSKRTPPASLPLILHLRVKLIPGEEIPLKLFKIMPYLANKYVPVITPLFDFNSNPMADIGEFVTYQDMTTCSAVVYFENSNSFYGVIGTDYYIRGLPYHFNEHGVYMGVVEVPYIFKRQHPSFHIDPSAVLPPFFDTNAWEEYLRPFKYSSNEGVKRPVEPVAGPSGKRVCNRREWAEAVQEDNAMAEKSVPKISRNKDLINMFTQYYIEILIFVTDDVVTLFKERYGIHYIERIIKYYIIYFNAVDMMFMKLSQHMRSRVNINIAKIVIENDLEPFSFINDGELQVADVITKLPEYLASHRMEYPPDSFDHIFISTSRTIKDDSIVVDGISTYDADLYKERKNHNYYNVVPASIVGFKTKGYEVALHQIARMLSIKIDPKEEGMTTAGQCYGIMQREGSKCTNCLKWSDQSKKQFNVFMRENRNRCFLLNKPRSLSRPGPLNMMTPNWQCQCFGYDSYIKYENGQIKPVVPRFGCLEPLQCVKQIGLRTYVKYTVPPFDGTPSNNDEVCWNGISERITI